MVHNYRHFTQPQARDSKGYSRVPFHLRENGIHLVSRNLSEQLEKETKDDTQKTGQGKRNGRRMRGSAVITNLIITVIRGGSFLVILSVQTRTDYGDVFCVWHALHVRHAWTQFGPTGTTDNSANGLSCSLYTAPRHDIRSTSMSTRLLPRTSWSFMFHRGNTPSSLVSRWRNPRFSERAVRKRCVKLFTSDGYCTRQWLSISCDLMSVYRIYSLGFTYM